MSKTLQLKRGNTSVSNSYIGSPGELTVDTSTWDVRVHDGVTAGGWILDSSNGGGSFSNITVASNATVGNLVIGGVIESTGNITANYFIGNGSQLTGLPQSYNDNDTIALLNNFNGNIIPSANATYSLGNVTNQWRELWVSNNTIYIGGVPIRADGNTITVDGQTLVRSGNSDSIVTTGNINAGNVLGIAIYGNLVGNHISHPLNDGLGVRLNSTDQSTLMVAKQSFNRTFDESNFEGYSLSILNTPNRVRVTFDANNGLYFKELLTRWSARYELIEFGDPVHFEYDYSNIRLSLEPDTYDIVTNVVKVSQFDSLIFDIEIDQDPIAVLVGAGAEAEEIGQIALRYDYNNTVGFDVERNKYGMAVDHDDIDIRAGRDIDLDAADDFRVVAGSSFNMSLERNDDQADDDGIYINLRNNWNTASEDTKTWTFGFNGNLYLPQGGNIIDSQGNSVFSGYATTSYVSSEIANLVSSAPGTLDTLNELAAALGDDPNFATTVSATLGNISVNVATLQGNISNLANVATSGSYTDLINKPTIPSLGNYTITYNDLSTSNAASNITFTISGADGNDPPAFIQRKWGLHVDGSFNFLDNFLGTPLANGTITTTKIGQWDLAYNRIYTNSNVESYLPTHSGNISVTNLIVSESIIASGASPAPSISGFSSADITGNITVGNILTDNYFYANGDPFVSSNYGDSDVISLLNSFGSNNISTTGNVTATNFIGNIEITGNVTGTSANVDIVADIYQWSFDNTGNLTLPGNTFAVNYANGVVVSFGGNYSDANVDAYLPTYSGNITAGNILTDNYFYANGDPFVSGGGSGISDLIQDTTPQLGGDLDINNNDITGTGNVNITGNITSSGNISAGNLIGTIATTSQTGITAVGTLGSLSVTGNVTGGNLITAGSAEITGNATIGNITTTNITGTEANVTITANSYVTTFDITGLATFPGAVQLAVYANTTVRDASITSPTPGMMIYVTGTGMQVRGATQWNTITGSGT